MDKPTPEKIARDIITYLEMARIAMVYVPEKIVEDMDISDAEFIRLVSELGNFLEHGEKTKQYLCAGDDEEFILTVGCFEEAKESAALFGAHVVREIK